MKVLIDKDYDIRFERFYQITKYFCPKCNTKLDNRKSNFCYLCGTPLEFDKVLDKETIIGFRDFVNGMLNKDYAIKKFYSQDKSQYGVMIGHDENEALVWGLEIFDNVFLDFVEDGTVEDLLDFSKTDSPLMKECELSPRFALLYRARTDKGITQHAKEIGIERLISFRSFDYVIDSFYIMMTKTLVTSTQIDNMINVIYKDFSPMIHDIITVDSLIFYNSPDGWVQVYGA